MTYDDGSSALLILGFCYFLLQQSGEGLDSDKVNTDDSSKFWNRASLENWKKDEVIESIRDRFVTGDWSKAGHRGQLSEANSDDDDNDDAVFGEFEDLETGEKHENHPTADNGGMHKDDDALLVEERRLKKLALRAKFDAQYPSRK